MLGSLGLSNFSRVRRIVLSSSNVCKAPIVHTPFLQRQIMTGCCAPAATAGSTACCEPDLDDTAVRQTVKQYYGEELKTSEDLKTSACKTCIPPPVEIRDLLRQVPEEVTSKFYGCGTPLPLGTTGLRVLDLGSGSGRDCYVASRLVGESGFVTGVDMTPAQLDVADRNLEAYTRDICKFEKPNMKFIHGEIEYLDKAGIPDESQDIVISNCVINLSPDKPRVLREVYRVLAPGGEMYFSDVYCDRRLPQAVRNHPVMIGECLGGALYINDFIRICRQVGFTDPRYLSVEPISVDDPELLAVSGEAQFFSVTFRLFKLPGKLEDVAEDYGQEAVYRGSLPGSLQQYILDDSTKLSTGIATRIDANTAAILSDSWLAKHFEVRGDRSVHRGQFAKSERSLAERAKAASAPCCPPAAAAAPAAAGTSEGSACCAPAAAAAAPAKGENPPAAAAKSSCCPPAAAAAPAVAQAQPCCPPPAASQPPQAAAVPKASCCPPAAAAAAPAAAQSQPCCPPAPAPEPAASAAKSSCCPPVAAAAAAAPAAAQSQPCCPPAPTSQQVAATPKESSCCPPGKCC